MGPSPSELVVPTHGWSAVCDGAFIACPYHPLSARVRLSALSATMVRFKYKRTDIDIYDHKRQCCDGGANSPPDKRGRRTEADAVLKPST